MAGVEGEGQNVDREKHFSLSPNNRTQGHPVKLINTRISTDKILFRKHISKLPGVVVMAAVLDGFERGLEEFMEEERSLGGYQP